MTSANASGTANGVMNLLFSTTQKKKFNLNIQEATRVVRQYYRSEPPKPVPECTSLQLWDIEVYE